MLSVLTKKLEEGISLDASEAALAAHALASEGEGTEAKAAFLAALARKGETVGEITALAATLRAMSVEPPIDAETRSLGILDVCGTGGDRLNTFNISTTVAFVAAAAGVPVAKHGNRAVTSQSGSADVLEELGVRIDLTPAEAAASLRERRFAFFFAPAFHPAFKHIAAARQLCAGRGQRTVFNFLGPLLNPARPAFQLVGVPRRALCHPVASVLHGLGMARAMVVCGSVGGGKHLDELSTLGRTAAAGFPPLMEKLRLIDPRTFPLQPATLQDLAGGDRRANAEIIRRILAGKERGPKRDAVLVNSAAALLVAGQCADLRAGWNLAGELIDSGRALKALIDLTAA